MQTKRQHAIATFVGLGAVLGLNPKALQAAVRNVSRPAPVPRFGKALAKACYKAGWARWQTHDTTLWGKAKAAAKLADTADELDGLLRFIIR